MVDHQAIPVGRIAHTALALAVTAGIVLLVRWSIRRAVSGGLEIPASVASELPSAQPVARTYDLAKLVPRELEVTVMGVSLDLSERTLEMPMELAERTCAAEAEAKGWKRAEEQGLRGHLNEVFGQTMWRRPDEAIVLRRLVPVNDSRTLLKETVLPTAGLSAGAGESTTLGEIESVRGLQTLNAVPSPLREILVGTPAYTQLMRRNGGSAFLMRMLTPMPSAAAERELGNRLAKAGWVRRTHLQRGHRLANLAVFAEFSPRMDGLPGCEIFYRFSDDEVYVTKKGAHE